MLEEWKIRQEIYHRLNRDHSDDLNNKKIVMSSNIVKDAIRYFKETDIGWIYPSKSYMVAICYARWLSKYFGGIPEHYLDNSDLLYKNDPYFVKYSYDLKTYMKILENIGGWKFDESRGMVPDVYEYFLKEFQIGEK
jgi:hypothetical protein